MDRDDAAAEALDERHRVLATDGRPVGVDLEHDLGGEQARGVFERGGVLDPRGQFPEVVAVVDADAVLGPFTAAALRRAAEERIASASCQCSAGR